MGRKSRNRETIAPQAVPLVLGGKWVECDVCGGTGIVPAPSAPGGMSLKSEAGSPSPSGPGIPATRGGEHHPPAQDTPPSGTGSASASFPVSSEPARAGAAQEDEG